MTVAQHSRPNEIAQSVKKLLLTSALVVGFSAYAVYQHFVAPPDAPVTVGATTGSGAGPQNPTAPARNGTAPTPSAVANQAAPTAKPSATPSRAAPAASTSSANGSGAGASPVPTRTPLPRPTATPTSAPAQTAGLYKDGEYVGNSTNAYWGNVQVKAVVQSGKLTDVQILDYPHDRNTSQRINSRAIPYLQSEAIQAQSAQVDMIGGATLTSRAYISSLQSALAKAKS